jgi:hypothetical protein
MLVTLRVTRAKALVVREAHLRFGGAARSQPHPEVTRLVARAARASGFVLAGRHAGAERLLRETAACLERRQAYAEAATALLELGWLLYERGRTREATPVARRSAAAPTLAEMRRQDARVACCRRGRGWKIFGLLMPKRCLALCCYLRPAPWSLRQRERRTPDVCSSRGVCAS